MAQNRALGFSLAASQATDPNNVWKVRLVRDNGCVLDPDNAEGADVPRAHASSRSYRMPDDDVPLRWYDVYFDLFGGAQARAAVYVIGRVNVFTAGVAASDTPDEIREVWPDRVAKRQGEDLYGGNYIDGKRNYGGVTVDLRDPVIPAPSGFMQ